MFFDNDFLFILGENKITVVDLKNNQKEEYFLNINSVPHTSCYNYLFGPAQGKSYEKDSIVENFTNNIKKRFKIKGGKVFVAIEDDALNIEERELTFYFATVLKVRRIMIFKQSIVLSHEERYVSLSKTNRAYILSYVRNNKIEGEKIIDIVKFDKENITTQIKKLHQDTLENNYNLYLNTYHDLDVEYSFGTKVDVDSMTNVVKEKKKILKIYNKVLY